MFITFLNKEDKCIGVRSSDVMDTTDEAYEKCFIQCEMTPLLHRHAVCVCLDLYSDVHDQNTDVFFYLYIHTIKFPFLHTRVCVVPNSGH